MCLINFTKSVFGRGSAPDPVPSMAMGMPTTFPRPLVGWEGIPLDAFGV